ncbi:hypothetical protein JCM11641_006238 [Rhodosporidiobolus odoratus]
MSASDHDEDNDPISILQPTGYSASTCGYCGRGKGQRSQDKSSKSYGALLDKGWRRSGSYLYKPDMGRTCCPQYTIYLTAQDFKPSKSQRQIMQRFNAFVQDGEREGQKGWGPPPATEETADEEMAPEGEGQKKNKGKGKGKANQSASEDWGELVRAAEWERRMEQKTFKHKFWCMLEPASFTDEKYQLYKRYQIDVHGDSPSKVTPSGFRSFLVDSPLEREPTASPSHSYGSHHMLYRLDGKLIALAVLDLLPNSVSSVYFIWDQDYAGMSLGKLSALREAQLVREMQRDGAWEGEGRYMMGFYIHSCAKMRYKADYQPSFLLDPETNTYFPFSTCKPLLDASSPRIASFSRPSSTALSSAPTRPASSKSDAKPIEDAEGSASEEEEEDDEGDLPSPPPLGCHDPDKLPKDLLLASFVLERRTLVPLLLSTVWHNPVQKREAQELLATTGDAAKGKMAIYLGR